MPVELHVSAAEAQRSVRAYQESMNPKNRLKPRLAKSTQNAMNNKCILIFNVGPWTWVRSMGSTGTYTIPGCKETETYASMPLLPETVVEFYPENEKKMAMMEDDGMYVAQQIIGIGMMMSPANSLVKYGVSIAEGMEPTPKELKKASSELEKTYQGYVREARAAYAKGQKFFEAVVRPDRHFLAAQKLGLNEVWMAQTTAKARIECLGCGEMANVGIVVHSCGYVLDTERFKTKEFQDRWTKK